MKRAVLTVGALMALVACDAAGPAPPPPSAAPPAPPAACLLDAAALNTATGVAWTPDATTASDTRCVYDTGSEFLTVTVEPLTAADPAAEIETLAPLCDKGSRVAITAAQGGFTCRFDRGQVFGALVRGDRVVTVTTSAVPAGTTTEKLSAGVRQQLARG